MSDEKEHRVLMCQATSGDWVLSHIRPESRITVYYGSDDVSRIPSLLRSFETTKSSWLGLISKSPAWVQERFDAFGMVFR